MTDRPVDSILPLQDTSVAMVVADVKAKIREQDRKARAGHFGGEHTLPGGPDQARLPILVEEVGEVAIEMNEMSKGNRDTDQGMYLELIDVAATATAWASALLEEEDGYR